MVTARLLSYAAIAVAAMLWLPGIAPAATFNAAADACQQHASEPCYLSFKPPLALGQFHYYASLTPDAPHDVPGPTSALIVIHGHPRDANTTFNAALEASRSAGVEKSTLIVAPVFQVAADDGGRCSTKGVPAAQAGDLLWSCTSWIDGAAAENAPQLTSFAATDALVNEVMRRWPTVHVITIAGFSAGAQMVQHYIGFAASSTDAVLRYVVADPGTWLYFDKVRPVAQTDGQTSGEAGCDTVACRYRLVRPDASCLTVNQWKYGVDELPATLNRSALAARAQYASADIHYLEAAQDSGPGPGTYSRILDKSCAAEAQGSFRLQRGLAYAAYDRQLLAPGKRRAVTVVPGCAHEVTCVWDSGASRNALFGATH